MKLLITIFIELAKHNSMMKYFNQEATPTDYNSGVTPVGKRAVFIAAEAHALEAADESS